MVHGVLRHSNPNNILRHFLNLIGRERLERKTEEGTAEQLVLMCVIQSKVRANLNLKPAVVRLVLSCNDTVLE